MPFLIEEGHFFVGLQSKNCHEFALSWALASRGMASVPQTKVHLSDFSVGDRGRDNHLLVAPRTDPDGRSLAHPVLISDEWRRSERQERDGALAVEESIAEPTRGCASTRSGVSGSVGEEYATRVQAPDPETPPDSPGFLVPRSS